ncbi:MAG: ABC transporter substrate-binding protein [Gammaproteobacteria bacterium]
MLYIRLFSILIIVLFNTAVAAEKTLIRLGLVAFGTAEWEIDALKRDAAAETLFELDIREVANPQAAKIALQSGAVDMIVADWIWVSRLRAGGEDYTFYPYSATSGALVVAADGPIRNLSDLKGKRLGIAGGELDKNWLLLQALVQQQQGFALDETVEKVFGAPPILNQQILDKRIDAVMTYWHFAARLEALGYRQLVDGRGIVNELGISETVPALGYVFKQSWADAHKAAVTSFFTAVYQARQQLCESDDAWKGILPLTRTEDKTLQDTLRKRYCEGTVEHWGEQEQQAAATLYRLLKTQSRNRLTGSDTELQPGTFWSVN